MTDNTSVDNQQASLTLDEASVELKRAMAFEDVPEEMIPMVLGIYEASEEAVREAWDSMPASAQNVLDNFDQFHALVAISQSYTGLDFMESFKNTQLPEDMSDEDKANYQASLLDKVLSTAVKDLIKQIKKARLKPNMKREIRAIFEAK
uniref:DUF3069 domain-containing protein n=1 Tax=Thaumasiovibrio occultus TaxID=1891184 RepID=UPI000B35FDF1|nr:DUF3069 domain-containing protein [Thaumasiovibrio occultus]